MLWHNWHYSSPVCIIPLPYLYAKSRQIAQDQGINMSPIFLNHVYLEIHVRSNHCNPQLSPGLFHEYELKRLLDLCEVGSDAVS